MKQRINDDLKAAMLAGDKPLVSILRSLKSAILYKEVEDGARDSGGLDDSVVLAVLKKEKKSRQDAYDMYLSAGEQPRADEEQYQMDVIAGYLPQELTEDQTRELVTQILADKGIENAEIKHMGMVMGQLKADGAAVDGGIVSKIIKELSA